MNDYTDKDISNISSLMLDNLDKIPGAEAESQFVNMEEFVGKFRAWRETTSTSPSRRHLGHYKALVTTIDR
jgi:hypothetical protein